MSESEGAVFQELRADSDDCGVSEIESLCVQCEENGTTKLLLTKIPFYKEVIIMSFECPHCGFTNSELQPAGKVQEKGCSMTLTVKNKTDLDRQVVKMRSAKLRIPSLDFEIPSESQKGMLTTVEGVLEQAVSGLSLQKDLIRESQPDTARKLEEFVDQLHTLKEESSLPWTLELDDPSGNSFIENPAAPRKDQGVVTECYDRTIEQNKMLGLLADDDVGGDDNDEDIDHADKIEKDEILSFRSNCPQCNAPVDTLMKPVDIPHFKQVIVMASNCETCGHRSNEIKSGSGVEPRGQKYTLLVGTTADLSRDVLKSETCTLLIPELDFEHETWVTGGKFTTVEGLLVDVKEQLVDKNPFYRGDSSNPHMADKLKEFGDQLNQIISGQRQNVTLILDDPAGNSYVQDLFSPEPDPRLKVEQYDRTFDHNEKLGINDMKTENYAADTS